MAVSAQTAWPELAIDWTGFQTAQPRVYTPDPVPRVGDERVAFEAWRAQNALRLPPAEPRRTEACAVGPPAAHPNRTEDGPTALHPGDPRGGVGVARLAQDAPAPRHGDAAIGHPQPQEVEVHWAERPVGAIRRESPPAVTDRDRGAPRAAPRLPHPSPTRASSVATAGRESPLEPGRRTRGPLQPR